MVTTPATPPRRPPEKAIPAELPLPHEREVSGAYTNQQPQAVVEQAKKDLDRGLVDTDLHGAAGVDDQRRRTLLERERKSTAGSKS